MSVKIVCLVSCVLVLGWAGPMSAAVIYSDSFDRPDSSDLGTNDNALGGIITAPWVEMESDPAQHQIADGALIVGGGANANSYDPGPLAFSKTYYWRVDEVNGAPDHTVFKGNVWNFTVETLSIPVLNITVDFGGVLARYVKLTIKAGYGVLPQVGLSEVRFYYIPTYAREAQPAPAALTDTADVVLSWRPGREAIVHKVYLGTDSSDLALATTVTEGQAAIGPLDYDTTYYWQIVEVNDAEVVTSYAGDMWSFTTPAFVVVDDFEQYDNDCHRIFFAWLDGLGHNGGENIDLSSVGGNLQNVTSLALGIEGANTPGKLYLDEIRLYPKTGEMITPVTPEDSDPSLVAYYEFEGNADNSFGQIVIGNNRSMNRPFIGTIDDVRIYDRALSAAEIAGLAGREGLIYIPF